MGVLSATAGILLTGRLNAATTSAGTSFEMDAIAACVIGGTSLMGGKGNVIRFADIDPEYGMDVSAWAFMRMDNGVKAIIDCSFEMDFREEYEIIGTKGTIKVPQAYRPDNNGGQGLIIINKNNGQRIERIYGDQYKLEIEHFSNAILNGTELAYDGANSVKNMRVIDACFESVKTGEKVSL
ncbi:hypothetical protein Cdeb_00631 [Caldibacillus debilis GB1]|jgi:xylose dehydrogenase (NAD/NADP)|uniref:Gfo/Idh/MocA-like oxidoreductase C-terminal domain-containing protein n=2 Tax=Caldibacillus debilis TaxID=301148 RepID=A0A420VGT4_9BACI|nr:hypothetical protein Cdeb_00631 [Caldibacillus debilis GB1]